MKKNDPQFLMKAAVKKFIAQQQPNASIAIIIFDDKVQFPLRLTSVEQMTQKNLTESLQYIDYRVKYTDIPAGIERAIYELKIKSRKTARKLIIFITDGIVDTGAADFELIKFISSRTEGEYYRAYEATDVIMAFLQINIILNTPKTVTTSIDNAKTKKHIPDIKLC